MRVKRLSVEVFNNASCEFVNQGHRYLRPSFFLLAAASNHKSTDLRSEWLTRAP